MHVFDSIGTPFGHETILPTAAKGITPSLYSGGQQVKAALVSVETNSVNYTLEGTTPTDSSGTNVGHEGVAQLNLVLRGVDAVKNFKCIDRVGASASKVKVTVFY